MPCIWQRCPQNELQSKLSCPTFSYRNDTEIAIFVAVNKNKVALISSKSKLENSGLKIWREISYFVHNKITQLLSYT